MGVRNISNKKWEINNFKTKIIPFIIQLHIASSKIYDKQDDIILK